MARSNKTRFAVLGILSIGPASGYDIKKMMEKSTNYFWREGDGSIYPVLKQLLKEKMVVCKIGNENSNKPKKIYFITKDGKADLKKWLKKDPELSQSRNELMLKIFFGANIHHTVSIHHIEKFCEQVRNNIDYYKGKLDRISENKLSGHEFHQYLTLRAGIFHSEASLKWADEAIKLLRNE